MKSSDGANRDHPHAYPGQSKHDGHISGSSGGDHLSAGAELLRKQHSTSADTGMSRPSKPQSRAK